MSRQLEQRRRRLRRRRRLMNDAILRLRTFSPFFNVHVAEMLLHPRPKDTGFNHELIAL